MNSLDPPDDLVLVPPEPPVLRVTIVEYEHEASKAAPHDDWWLLFRVGLLQKGKKEVLKKTSCRRDGFWDEVIELDLPNDGEPSVRIQLLVWGRLSNTELATLDLAVESVRALVWENDLYVSSCASLSANPDSS